MLKVRHVTENIKKYYICAGIILLLVVVNCLGHQFEIIFIFTVRESDRKPGSYVLSYLGRTGINHFR